MDILVNGETKEVEESLNLVQLLDKLGFAGRRVAVELNLEIVPRDSYTSQQIKAGDRLEIVQAIGGG